MWRKVVVMDTGAEPNCVKKSEIPPGTDELFRSPLKFCLLRTGGKLIAIHGSVTLSVRVGIRKVIYQFLLFDTLQVDCILGTEYIYHHLGNRNIQ